MQISELLINREKYSIFCYGAGVGYSRVVKILENNMDICAVIDREGSKWGRIYGTSTICKGPEELKKYDNAVVIVTVDTKDIYDEIVNDIKVFNVTEVFHVGEVIGEIRRAHTKSMNFSAADKNISDLIDVQKRSEISKKEITFVVTGKMVYDSAIPSDRSIQSIKQFFPESKIILSTWTGEDIEPVRSICDEIVLTDEPEAKFNIFLEGHIPQKINNINKQQVVVKNGLNKVKTKYAVRFRTDFELIDDRFMQFYEHWNNNYSKRNRIKTLFEDRILAVNTFMHNPDVFDNAYSYMLSDCFLFGTTDDMKILWDGYQAPDEVMNCFSGGFGAGMDNPAEFNHRYNAEQIFLLNAIRKSKLDVSIPSHYADNSDEKILSDYEQIIASNVIIGDNADLGLHSRFDYLFNYIFYTHRDDVYFYLKYLDDQNTECRAFLSD